MTTVDELIEGKRIVVCAGPGGVGKTTASAAIAAGMAARGLKVAVVTIDPARRLADALGLDRLDNDPRLVEPEVFAAHGLELKGELWAMMLDAKRTFDALIERVAPSDAARDEVLSNRIYQELSNAVAGSQEFTAISKLYELDQEGDFDLLVLDTPPSRNALDFLDAPDRLTGFFQGRAIRMFLRPAGIGGRVIGAGTGVVFGILRRVTGVDLLDELSVFFRSLGGIIDSITQRAARVKALLADPSTTFLLVTSPEREPVEEALHFHRRLLEQGLPFGGVVVNRVREDHGDPEPPQGIEGELAERVLQAARDIAVLAERDAGSIRRLAADLDGRPLVTVPQLPGDVHDLEGLARMCEHLFASAMVRDGGVGGSRR